MTPILTRIKNLFRKSKIDRDLHDELSTHLQLHIDDNLRAGMTPEAARKDALLKLGGLEQTKELVRDRHLLPWLDTLRADILFGTRQLFKNKITSAAAILSLALAIGACTSAFRLIDAIFLRPLPVASADRLYYLSRSTFDAQGIAHDFDGWAYPDFALLRDAAKGQAQLFAVSYEERTDLTYKSDQEMEKAHINYVSGGMFSAFGLKPALGRLLTPDDDATPGKQPVAVISYDYWTRRFQNDPNVLGKTFRFGNNFFQIVGVCDPPFTGVEPGTMTEIFIPTMMHRSVTRGDSTWHRIFAIMQPGTAIEPLRAKLDAINRAFETERSKSWANEPPDEVALYLNQTLNFHSAIAGASGFQQDFRSSLYTIGVLVFFVLLIACVNVANLLFAQAASRAREMALRISIGAGRRQLLQLVLVESEILALVSAALGAFFAAWSAPYVLSLLNGTSDNPTRLSMPADYRVFFFMVALTAAVTCLFGLFPALRASSTQPVSALKGGEDPHSRRRLMYVLIGAQVAFCCLVLFMAGLFVTTFQRLSHQSVGFNTNRLLILDTVTRQSVPPSTWIQVADQLRNTPGVERVSVSNGALMSGNSNNDSISINGGPPTSTVAHFRNISPGWLETHQIPILSGRDFLPSEITPVAREGTATATSMDGAAIVNQTFADTFFHDQNVVGKSFDELLPENKRAHFLIVGLTRDATYRGIREKQLPVAYLPFNTTEPNPWWSADGATFIVRTSLDNPLALAATLRSAVPQIRPGLRVSNIFSQNELVQGQTTRERFLATLASFFAGVALLLAAIGLYGVLHYSVIQRRREIAIRLAIGAQAPGIARLVTLPLFSMIAIGAAAGIGAGLFAAHYLADLFYRVHPTDASILAFPTAAIFLAAIVATSPAILRAIHTDPASTLRSE
jgi:putative ABC transport system permease protein